VPVFISARSGCFIPLPLEKSPGAAILLHGITASNVRKCGKRQDLAEKSTHRGFSWLHRILKAVIEGCFWDTIVVYTDNVREDRGLSEQRQPPRTAGTAWMYTVLKVR
jgi:hypothetical protein